MATTQDHVCIIKTEWGTVKSTLALCAYINWPNCKLKSDTIELNVQPLYVHVTMHAFYF